MASPTGKRTRDSRKRSRGDHRRRRPRRYTAALYAARANMRPLVIEGFSWGGQLMITSDVENYPGYPDGVLGPEMMQEFRRQAERFGSEFITDDATRVDLSEAPFRVWVGDDEFRAGPHRRDRGDRAPARPGIGARASGARGQLLRGLRCGLLPRPRGRRRRRRRLRHGGGDLPRQVRVARLPSSIGATSSGPRRSWSTARGRTRGSSSCSTRSCDDVARCRRRPGYGRAHRESEVGRAARDPAPTASSSRSAMTRRPGSSRASSTWTRPATS